MLPEFSSKFPLELLSEFLPAGPAGPAGPVGPASKTWLCQSKDPGWGKDERNGPGGGWDGSTRGNYLLECTKAGSLSDCNNIGHCNWSWGQGPYMS